MNDSRIIRMKIVKMALLQLNKKYVHGSRGLDTFDCASFVWQVFHEVLGVDVFKGGYGLSTTTKLLTSPMGVTNDDVILSTVKNGDILFFHTQSKKDNEPKPDNKYPGHCGIYLGNEDVIHCTTMNDLNRVAITNLNNDDEFSKHLNKIIVASKNIVDYYK